MDLASAEYAAAVKGVHRENPLINRHLSNAGFRPACGPKPGDRTFLSQPEREDRMQVWNSKWVACALVASGLTSAQAGTIVDVEAANPYGRVLSLAAGTYELAFAGIADGGLYDAWTAWAPGEICGVDGAGVPIPCPSGYINELRLEGVDPDQVIAAGNAKLVDTDTAFGPVRVFIGDHFNPIWSTPVEALQAAKSNIPSFRLTMAPPGDVRFLAGENPGFGCFTGFDTPCWSDNSGGISLTISSVPEPGIGALLAAGFAIAGLAIRRKDVKTGRARA